MVLVVGKSFLILCIILWHVRWLSSFPGISLSPFLKFLIYIYTKTKEEGYALTEANLIGVKVLWKMFNRNHSAFLLLGRAYYWMNMSFLNTTYWVFMYISTLISDNLKNVFIPYGQVEIRLKWNHLSWFFKKDFW